MRSVAKLTALSLLVGLGIYGTVSALMRASDRGPPESLREAGSPSELPPPSPDAADAQTPEDVVERCCELRHGCLSVKNTIQT